MSETLSKKLNEAAEKISQLVEFPIKVTFDTELNKSKKPIQELEKTFDGILLEGFTSTKQTSPGLVSWFKKDPRNLDAFRYHVAEIRMIGIDTNKNFKSPGNWYYDLFIENFILFVQVEDGRDRYTTDGFSQKFEWVLKSLPPVPEKPGESVLDKKLKAVAEKVSGLAGFTIKVTFDEKKTVSKKTRADFEKTFDGVIDEGFTSTKQTSVGLITWFKKDPKNVEVFQHHVKEICIIGIESNKNFKSPGNWYYDLTFDNGILNVWVEDGRDRYVVDGFTEKFVWLLKSLPSVEVKEKPVEVSKPLETPKPDEESPLEVALKIVSQKMTDLVGFAIKVSFDGSKTNSKKDVKDMSKNFPGVIEEGFTSTKQSNGLATWFKKDPKNLAAFQHHIKEIKMIGTENNKNFKSPGNWYYDLFVENGVLYINVEDGRDRYVTDGFSEKFTWVLKSLPVLEEKQAPVKMETSKPVEASPGEESPLEKSLKVVSDKIQKLVGFAVAISYDPTRSTTKKDVKDLAKTYDGVIDEGFSSTKPSSGLATWFKKDPKNLAAFQHYVKEIKMVGAENNKLFKSPGNWYYDLSFENGTLFVHVEDGRDRYVTDGFSEKFMWILKSLAPIESKDAPVQVTVAKVAEMTPQATSSIETTQVKEIQDAETKIVGLIGFPLKISIDESKNNTKKEIKTFYRDWAGILDEGFTSKKHTSAGLVEWFNKSSNNKHLFQSVVKGISIYGALDNKKFTSPGCWYYDLGWNNGILEVIVEEGRDRNVCDGFAIKLEALFAKIPEVQALKSFVLFDQVAENLTKMTGFPIKVTFDSSKNTGKMDNIDKIVGVIDEGFVSKKEKSLGLINGWFKSGENQKHFQDLVKEMKIYGAPDHKSFTSPGCWYYHLIFEPQVENGTLYIVLEQGYDRTLTDGFSEKMAWIYTNDFEPLIQSNQARKVILTTFDKIQKDFGVNVVVEWNTFVNSSQFKTKSFSDREKVLKSFTETKMETLQRVLTKLTKFEVGKSKLLASVKQISVSVDLNASNPVTLSLKDQILHLVFALDQSTMDDDSLYLEFSNAIQSLVPIEIEFAKLKIAEIHGQFLNSIAPNKLDVNMDWKFTETSKFLSLVPLEQRKIITKLYLTNLFGLLDLILDVYMGIRASFFSDTKGIREEFARQFSQEFPGWIFLSQNLNKVEITFDMDSTHDSLLTFKEKTVHFALNPKNQDNAGLTFSRVQCLFDLVGKIAEYDAKKMISLHENGEVPFKITIDTSYQKNSKFSSKNFVSQVDVTRSFYLKSIDKVCKVLGVIARHPVGKTEISAKVKTVSFVLDVENKSPLVGDFSLNGDVFAVKINMDELQAFLDTKDQVVKSTIELVFNLVVRIALYDNQANVSKLESNLGSLLGSQVKIVIGTDFTLVEAFKGKQPAVQSEIVASLSTNIADVFVGNEIMKLAKSKVGGDSLKTLKQILITADPQNKQSNEGSLQLENQVLTLTFNMDHVNAKSVPINVYWKTQDLFGITVSVAQEVSQGQFLKVTQDFNTKFEKNVVFEIDYGFTQQDAFKSLLPQARHNIIQYLSSNLIEMIFSQKEGLLGFISLVKKEIHDAIGKIILSIDCKDSQKDSYDVSVQNGVLGACFNLKDVTNQTKLEPCRLKVEQILLLRQIKEARAIQHANEALEKVRSSSDVKIPLEFNWKSLTDSASFKESTRYVEMIEASTKVCETAIFGQYGVKKTLHVEAVDALNKLNKIIFSIDCSNATKNNVGLYTPNYVVSSESGVLKVQSNYTQGDQGCGMCVEYTLTPNVARTREARITEELRRAEEERKRQEEQRRRDEDERRRKDDEERRIREEKERIELDKKRREKCSYDRCENGWCKCTNCKGTGDGRNNNRCGFCAGQGREKCGSCHGTGLKYPGL